MRPILQVEDDPNDVFFLQHAMKKAGVANPIQVASDGQQAIDYLRGAGIYSNREQFPFPCLVLLDLKLPYIMGLDVLKWIRQDERRTLPVVMLTASAEDADIASAYRLGANAFLTKPSAAAKLEDIARAIKEFWLTHNTMPREELLEHHSMVRETAPESPMEGVVSLAGSPSNGFERTKRSPIVGIHTAYFTQTDS